MNQTDASKAIAQGWIAAWPTASGGIPYVFENDVTDEASSYARVQIQHLFSEQWTMGGVGNRKYRRSGVAVVKLKTLANTGRKGMDLLCDIVRGVLESTRFAATGTEPGVVTEAASGGKSSTDGQYWSSVLTVPFYFFETR